MANKCLETMLCIKVPELYVGVFRTGTRYKRDGIDSRALKIRVYLKISLIFYSSITESVTDESIEDPNMSLC